MHDTPLYGAVPIVDAVATYERGAARTIFAVNRSMTEEVTLEIDTGALSAPSRPRRRTSLWGTTTSMRRTRWGVQSASLRCVNETVHLRQGKVTITLTRPCRGAALTLE